MLPHSNRCLVVRFVFPPTQRAEQRSKQGKSNQVCRLANVFRCLLRIPLPSIAHQLTWPLFLPAEKDLGFLRIGSLNVRVKKTTEAFSNFLGVGPGTQRHTSHPQQRFRNTIQSSATLTEEHEPDGAETGGKQQNHLKAWNSVDDIPVVSGDWRGEDCKRGIFKESILLSSRTKCHPQNIPERRSETDRSGTRSTRPSATACHPHRVNSTGRWTRTRTLSRTRDRRGTSTETTLTLDSTPTGTVGDLPLRCVQLIFNLFVYIINYVLKSTWIPSI